MIRSEILKKALEMNIDELQETINLYNSAIGIMTEVKRIRIRDGERTAEMIKRQARRNATKVPVNQDKTQHKPQQEQRNDNLSAEPSHEY